ncbi:hypothetical protein [Mycobacteroides abscessus]|uniref:hypothetical protein n=1 Tax=Mycobacteroides abscessus TaxID=36809 RepID=UPI00092C1447|nr:hypothetical protein [Mycobacteroides abscessus]SHP98422.1 Uncharacterised protein [Mycobacteroides abscessus subsp. abscessus]SHQ61048.1 Uncharacterised protein [Mycobacteroides abscessus subsp. abscessus]SKD63523.1 Uncharacterised protein [Mycobacteroides abscessus subsp. abscessus]SLD63040.1 Uncharacterised protein [Mycobacteroides abscessus subsp. abscessus]
MRGIVGGVFYVLGGMMLLSALLNACSSNEGSGQGAISAAVLAMIFLGIGHLIYPLISGGRGGVPVDPAEYARIQRDRALDAARQERQAGQRAAQRQLDAMKREIIDNANRRNRDLGGGR